MIVAVACDHAGFPMKAWVIETVKEAGHEVLDFGTDSEESVDFPDFTRKVGAAIQNGQAERGIMVCGSGVGAAIAANKMKGIYASVCHDVYCAHQGVEHDDMNVLCIGARVIGLEIAREVVLAFLGAQFLNEDRYVRRLEKLKKIEKAGS